MMRTSIAAVMTALLVPATALAGHGGGGGGGSHSGGGGGGGGGGSHSSGGGGGFHSSGPSSSSSHTTGGGGSYHPGHVSGEPHSADGPVHHGGGTGGGGNGGPVIVGGGGHGGSRGPHGTYVGGGEYGGGDVYVDGGGEYVESSCDDDGNCVQAPTVRVPMLVEVGMIGASFQGPQIMRGGSVGFLGDSYGYTLSSGTPNGRDTSAGLVAARVSFGLGAHLYLGAEIAGGELSQSPMQVTSDGTAHMVDATPTLERTTMLAYDVFAGVRARSGAMELDGELAAGGRHFASTIDPVYQGTDFGEGDMVNEDLPLVEARVRGAVWVTPHVSLALQIGTGLEDRSELTGGLMLGFAATPYAEPLP